MFMGENMLKKLVLILIPIACLGLLLWFTGAPERETKISEVTSVQSQEVTRIVFSDGRGRNKPFTLNDQRKINDFMNMLDGYVIKKEKRHEDFTGWIHGADFYKDDKKLFSIVFTNPLEIDGKYYDIIKGDMEPEKIDNFIKSTSPDWIIP